MIRKLKNILRTIVAPSRQLLSLEIDRYILTLKENPKYTKKSLPQFEFQTFSQNGEDGIIAEIFRRIGTTNKKFVEFGVESGIENNTANLLLHDWTGLWIEGSKSFYDKLVSGYSQQISDRKLIAINAMVRPDNIEEILYKSGIPEEFDLLSIDIDSNDWYVWQSIKSFRPRVVILEYNAHFAPSDDVVIIYNADARYDGTFYFGASLKAYCTLAEKKGYKIVGCDLTGTNAFFVRSDLADDRFQEPFTAEFHYEPFRYFLNRRLGHPQRAGAFTSAETLLK